MVSLVNRLNGPDCVFSGKAARPVTEAEEAHVVLAVLCAFLVGGVAVTLHALSVTAAGL
jgi:hypothetical protein